MNRYCVRWSEERGGWEYTNNHGNDWFDLDYEEKEDVKYAIVLSSLLMGVRGEDIEFVE